MAKRQGEELFDTGDKDELGSQPISENGAQTNPDHEDARLTDFVELDRSDPHFLANAYDMYAELREKGPVSRARIVGAEEQRLKERRGFFRSETFFVTHYDEVLATLLDDRFSVDPRAELSPEELKQESSMPEEFRLISRSLISLDPPDHTRLRKLAQPSFTGRGMQALRGNIQQIVDDFLDQAERDAAERGEEAPNRRMDLIEAFAYPFPVTVISDMLGIPREDRETIRGWTENLLRADRFRDQEVDEEVDQEVRVGLR